MSSRHVPGNKRRPAKKAPAVAKKATPVKSRNPRMKGRDISAYKGELVPGNKRRGGQRNRFPKGNPGRPAGVPDIVPRSVKASMKQLFEEVAQTEQATLRSALMRGIRRGGAKHSDRYIRLVAEYVDGKPVDTLNLNSQFKSETLEAAADQLKKQMTLLVQSVMKRRAEQ